MDPSHLIPIEDNFWEIGAGPSGPDTEIFFDRGEAFDPENIGLRLLAQKIENVRYILKSGTSLSQFNTDTLLFRSVNTRNCHIRTYTGALVWSVLWLLSKGLRPTETDLSSCRLSVKSRNCLVRFMTKIDNMSFKVIADHIRSLSFAIGDGALPGNEGRGYVLRRLLRRASMHGQKLGINEPFLFTNWFQVGKITWSYYPEVLEKRDFLLKKSLRAEESFAPSPFTQVNTLPGIVADLKEKGQSVIVGSYVFKLYDTLMGSQ